MISKTLSKKSLLYGGACVLTMLLLAGCGDGRPHRVPVSGVVLIDDKPLTHGFIRFHPAGGRPATGKLDEQGRFTLTCFDKGDGVMPGTHPVSISAFEMLNARAVRWHAPKKYSSPKTSEITQTIEGPTDTVEIKITWNGGTPFVERVME